MKLLICEGAGEISFIYYLIENLGYHLKKSKEEIYKFRNMSNNNFLQNEIIEDFCILNLDGHGNVEKVCEMLKKDPNFNTLKSISFFVDAEKEYDAHKILYESKLEDFKIQIPTLKTSLFISPDNRNNGMLEDLILKIVKHQDIKNYIKDKVTPSLEKEKNDKIKNHPKANLMIYSATYNSLEGKLHTLLSDIPAEIDYSSEKLNDIKNFINDIIQN